MSKRGKLRQFISADSKLGFSGLGKGLIHPRCAIHAKTMRYGSDDMLQRLVAFEAGREKDMLTTRVHTHLKMRRTGNGLLEHFLCINQITSTQQGCMP